MVQNIGDLRKDSTEGEKKFKKLINSIYREDDSIYCYYEPPLGSYKPDFLLIGANIGILLVEIKDYNQENLEETPATGNWKFKEKTGQINPYVNNPFEQIYNYWRETKAKLNSNKETFRENIPIYQLVVFTNIEMEHPIGYKILRSCPNKVDICFSNNLTDGKILHEFLRGIIQDKINLEPKIIDLIRYNINPNCRLPHKDQPKLDGWLKLDDIDKIRLLDKEQESMAHSLGEGHRIFYGVAGSGKTVLLIARARYLALQNPNWNILVLCYNKVLSKSLQQLINPQDFHADITVSNFHAWAYSFLQNFEGYDVKLKLLKQKLGLSQKERDLFYNDTIPDLLLEVSLLPHKKYDAILIDEGQDFKFKWFLAIMQFLNPETNSLLITLDGLQGIYKKNKYRWVDCGIDARGRVKKFRRSYRNPIEIGMLASHVIPNNLVQMLDMNLDEFLRTEEFLGKNGVVDLIVFEDRVKEYQYISDIAKKSNSENSKVLILMKKNLQNAYNREIIKDALNSSNVDWFNLKDWNESQSSTFIGTIHSSKGIESEVVLIPEIDKYRSEADQQLLYVAMTRTVQKLIITAGKETELVKRLKSALNIKKLQKKINHD